MFNPFQNIPQIFHIAVRKPLIFKIVSKLKSGKPPENLGIVYPHFSEANDLLSERILRKWGKSSQPVSLAPPYPLR